MMNKVNAACQSLAAGTKKNVLDRIAKQQVQSANNKKPKSSSPKEVFVIGNPRTTVEVVVTTKGHKSASTMANNRQANSTASKLTDDSHTNNWSKTLREQNRPAIKQGVQQLVAHMQASKHNRHDNPERKDIKTAAESHKSQKYSRQENRILDEIPVKLSVKRPSEHVKTAPNSAVPSNTTIASSMESIEVTDRGVQCGGIFDRSNDRFSAYNPVRTIGFLMKEMEGLVRDERSSNILTEMEQTLLRIPMESGKAAPVLDATTAKLAESSAKIESMCAAQREEIESLLQQVNKQAAMLEEAKQRERNLESEVKEIKMELNDALKSGAESRRIISQLQQENKNIEVTEKLVTELRRELNDQIELAAQRLTEGQYLQLEKEKFSILSSYKDSKLVELRTALKELQNHFSEQLIDLEARKRASDASGDRQASVIHGGVACSSPTSSCSNNSIVPASCPELSEISLSTADRFTNSVLPTSKPLAKTQLPSSYCNGSLDDSETERPCDKTQLEFISLPGGETSHVISVSHRKDEERNVIASSHKKKEEPPNIDRKVEGFHSVPNFGGRIRGDSLHRLDRDNKDSEPKTKSRKSSSAEKRRSNDAKSSLNHEEVKRTGADCASGDPASIKQQFEIMFEDIRKQSKFPIHVPSPPRNYPCPDWSDSSLPTFSGISGSNIF